VQNRPLGVSEVQSNPLKSRRSFRFLNAGRQFLKGLVSPITMIFESRQNFLMGLGMLLGGGALMLATGGAISPLLISLGIGMGVFQGGQALYKISKAKSNEEIEAAFHDVGAATSTVGLSLLGAKGSLKGSGVLKSTGLTAVEVDNLTIWQAAIKNIQLTRSAAQTSYQAVRSGEAAHNILAFGAQLANKFPKLNPNKLPEFKLTPDKISDSPMLEAIALEPAAVRPAPKPLQQLASLETPTPTTMKKPPHLRSPQELTPGHVAERLSTQVNTYTEMELAGLLNGLSPQERLIAIESLKQMTQFGNMKSLNGLTEGLVSLQKSGMIVAGDSTNGSLSSVLSYLKSKGSFSELKIEPLSTALGQEKPVALVLDTMLLDRMHHDPSFLNLLIQKKQSIRLILPEGWHGGVNPFNQGTLTSLNGKLLPVISRVKKLQSSTGATLESAVSDALVEPILTQLDGIPGGWRSQVVRMKNPQWNALEGKATTGQSSRLNTVVNQLEAPSLSAEQIQAIVSKISPEESVQQGILEMLMRAGEVYSPRRAGIEVAKLHELVLAQSKKLGIPPENLYFVLRDNESSFAVVAQMYQQVNHIPGSRFILAEQLPQLPTHGSHRGFVILDDLMGSGKTLRDMVRDDVLPRVRPGDQVLVSPIVSTTLARTEMMEPLIANCPRVHYTPGREMTPFHKTDYFESLTSAEKTLFEAIFQHKGYRDTNTCTTFPWMATNTNNLLFSQHFAEPYLLNGMGNKIYIPKPKPFPLQ
ncbi:MAG: hypothetical protein K2X66_09985, partial [Cyanobacteria bacterium]|nr:hypothetical protein [Cyanobacteriota bacterium]